MPRKVIDIDGLTGDEIDVLTGEQIDGLPGKSNQMAFNVSDKVRVADQSSEYRGHRGVVKAVSGSLHQVRLEGHGCSSRVPMRTDQLKADAATDTLSYAQCTG